MCDTALWATTLMNTLHAHRQAVLYRANIVAGFVLALVFALFLTPAAGGVSLANVPAIGTASDGTFLADQAGDRHIPSVSSIIDKYDRDLSVFTSFIDAFGGLNMTDEIRNPNSYEFEILERTPFPRFAQVNGVSGAGSADAAVTVTVDSGHVIVPGCILKSFSNATDATLDYYVTASTATEITIKALPKVVASARGFSRTSVAFGTVPAFADGEYLRWVGNSKSEEDAASRAIALEPDVTYQVIQTFDAVCSLSGHAEQLSVYGSVDLATDRQRQCVEEFKKSRELAYLFQGQLAITSNLNLNEEQRKFLKMRGSRGYITGAITLPANPTLADIVNFTYDANEGHDGKTTKLLLCGEDVANRFDTTAASTDLVRTVQDETTLGVEVMHVKGRKGGVDVVYHPLFDEMGLQAEGHLYDMRYLGRSVMRDVREHGGGENQRDTGKMVDRTLWQLFSEEALVMHRATGTRAVHKRVVLA
ncbi:MAG: hypothetical protein Rubg2KO_15490 [Rubricoccaceae bacterium]